VLSLASVAAGCAGADSAAALPGLVELVVSKGALEVVSAGAPGDAAGVVASAGALEVSAAGAALGDGLPLAVGLSTGALAEFDDDSLAGASSSAGRLGDVGVEAARRTDFVPATCFDGVFALGAGVSSGCGALAAIPSSALATTLPGPEFVSATFGVGAGVGFAALLKGDGTDRLAGGFDHSWSSTSAPPMATTTMVPKAIGKCFIEFSCPGVSGSGTGRGRAGCPAQATIG
jgi:hypothetical protein